MAEIATRFAAATTPPIDRRTLRERSFPIPKIPASEPTSAKRTNGKLWPMRTPAPIACTAAKRSAGPIPATRLAMIEPAANGIA